MKQKENTYCLVCDKKTGDKKIRGVALANKIATQRSLCALFVLQENQLFIDKNIKFIGNVKRNADLVL